MAEGRYVGRWLLKEEPIPDGHRAVYSSSFAHLDQLDRINRLRPLEYDTSCPSIQTSWEMKLFCKRVPEGENVYNFSVNLRRIDYSALHVNASLHVSIFDIDNMPTIFMVDSIDIGLLHDSGYEDKVKIHPTDIRVEYVLEVKHCHSDNDCNGASKF